MFIPSFSRTHSCGFTLVELVTTLVIIGILSAAAVPKLFDNQIFSERGYVDDFASALRYAQRIAGATQCNVRVIIDVNGYSAFQQVPVCNVAGNAWTSAVLRGDGSTLAGTPPSGVTLTPAATITFDLNGDVLGAVPPAFDVDGVFTLQVASNGFLTVSP
jgi:MSHA pilin protein MshC